MEANRREKYTRIKELNCFPEVEQQVIAGFKIPDIARFIQEEREEYTDVARESLVTMLAAFKRDMPPAQILESASPETALEVKKAREKFGDKLAELEELSDLVTIQKKNVLAGLRMVEKSGFPQQRLGVEVLNMAAVVMKMHAIKMDLGLTKAGGRELGTLTISAEKMSEIRKRHGREAAEALAKPESRARALAVVRRLTAVATVPMEEPEEEDDEE